MKIGSRKKYLLVAGFGLLVFLYGIGALSPLETIVGKTLNPVFKRFFAFSTEIRSAYEGQTSKRDLSKEIVDLKSEIMRLNEENASLKTVYRENDILREHLGFLERNKLNYVMANVVSREDILNIGAQTETITIDKGAQDGIFTGAAVINKEGVVVGKIFEVKESISRVFLANSDKCKFAASILGEENTSGIARGSQGLVIRMDFIPQIKNLAVGDMVVTSGLEEAVPRGLAIGKISEINKENNELWQNAVIEPFSDMNELIIVSAVLPENKSE
jgi:rod shape-determining protein MreC